MSPTPVLGDLSVSATTAPGDWIVSSVRPFADHTVGSLLPVSFPAYARIFHPAERRLGAAIVDVRWADVASANRRICHPIMEWASITGDQLDGQAAVWDQTPRLGSLPRRQIQRLSKVLATQTAVSSHCWFAVWEGFGALAISVGAGIDRLEMPERPMILLSGPITAATTSLAEPPFEQHASLWWPDDRSWCVATDVDLMTTYVGGSRRCIDTLVADIELEALPARVDQSLAWNADLLNPAPRRQIF